jgi:acetyltransferase-like isoleucine patch superfamily enzyme
MTDRTLDKNDIQESIGGERSAFRKYQDFFVGKRGIWSLIKYEIAHVLASPVPGALGYVLRKMLMSPLLKAAGDGVQIGRSVTFRHPEKISIGEGSAIDDGCVLDARGVEDGPFAIGKEVIIARGTALTSKTAEGSIEIGDHCTVGKNCILSSTSGIQIGSHVAIAGDCYFGGGRYRTERTDVPMLEQGLYTKGPVVIGDDCWIGAGAKVLDGITIGRGSIISAGTVVHKDVPEYTTVIGRQPLKMRSRTEE